MPGPRIAFETPRVGTGLTIADRIDGKRFTLETPEPVTTAPVSTDPFPTRLDSAVAVDVSAIGYDTFVSLYVRDETGAMLEKVLYGTDTHYAGGSFVIEMGAPMKIVLDFEGAFTVDTGPEGTAITFDGDTTVRIGARSHHRSPEATIVTTDAVDDMMTAVSRLSSALKTTSPERSFPTLRGHPPLVEVGDELEIPEGLDRPDTGIRIEIPAGRRYVYEVAPLAYYLGAALIPGEDPRIATDRGFSYGLSSGAGFQADVENVLKQVFLLDCVTRTEGYFPVVLHERERLEPDLDLDLESLYDDPLVDQLEAYLDVPGELLEPHFPTWKVTAHVTPDVRSVSRLPFVLNELGLVRTVTPEETKTPTAPRSPAGTGTDEAALYGAYETFSPDPEPLVEIEESGSLTDVWYGDGIPTNATKGLPVAHRNRLDRSSRDDDVSVAVVLNDPEMSGEKDIGAIYGNREKIPFDVTVATDLDVEALRDLLARDHDFLHYIGHVGNEGMQCADGRLDTRSIGSVGVDAFLLNACHSYEQGIGLLQAGAIGGVVTIRDVVNAEAVAAGKTFAALMDRGFPLNAALDVVAEVSIIGDFYAVIGDGEVTVTQLESGSAPVVEISTGPPAEAALRTYPTTEKGMGTLQGANVETVESVSLNSGRIPIPREALLESLSMERMPVLLDGELYWSQDGDLQERLEGILHSSE